MSNTQHTRLAQEFPPALPAAIQGVQVTAGNPFQKPEIDAQINYMRGKIEELETWLEYIGDEADISTVESVKQEIDILRAIQENLIAVRMFDRAGLPVPSKPQEVRHA